MYLTTLLFLLTSMSAFASFVQPDLNQMTDIQRTATLPPFPLQYPPVGHPANPYTPTQQQPLQSMQPQMQEAPPQPQMMPQQQMQAPQQPQMMPQQQMQAPQQPQMMPQQPFPQPAQPQMIPQQQMQAPSFQYQPQEQQEAPAGNPQGNNQQNNPQNTGHVLSNIPVLPEFENQDGMAVVYNQKDKNLKWNPCRGHYPKGCEFSILHGDVNRPESDYYVRVPSQYEFPAHIQTSTSHMALVDGELRMKYLNQKEFKLKEGNFVFLPPNIPRNMRCTSKEACVMFVHFDKATVSLPYNGKF